MRHLLNENGTLVLIPENGNDVRLLYHLMNCPDLSQFSEYLLKERTTGELNKHVTLDLGVPAEDLDYYPVGLAGDIHIPSGDIKMPSGDWGRYGKIGQYDFSNSDADPLQYRTPVGSLTYDNQTIELV
mgnify:CR=1 FL=1